MTRMGLTHSIRLYSVNLTVSSNRYAYLFMLAQLQ